MDGLYWNNIPLADFVEALKSSEMLWKGKVGARWPNTEDIELILHVASKLQLLNVTKYTSIRYVT